MIEDVFKMALTMINPYDYEELVKLCKTHYHTPPNLLYYYQKIGLIHGAKYRFPEMEIDDAYVRLLKIVNAYSEQVKVPKKGKCQECNSIRTKVKQMWSLTKDIFKLSIKKIKTGGTYEHT